MRHLRINILSIVLAGSLLLICGNFGRAEIRQEDDSTALQLLGEKVLAVVQSKRPESLKGYLLIICQAPLWKALAKDADVGPFLRFKTAASDLHAVLVMPANPKNGSTYCVYFEGKKPIGFTEIKTAKGDKITGENVAKAYVALTEDYNVKGQPIFEKGVVHSDDDIPIPTLVVKDDGQK